jgi:hypothetical protein
MKIVADGLTLARSIVWHFESNAAINRCAEFGCPASDEAHHRTTCAQCRLCRGTSSPARSVSIIAHGHNGALTAFYRNREEACAS